MWGGRGPTANGLAGESNGEERNWILISGRPTAAPHSSHDLLSYQYTFRFHTMPNACAVLPPAARMTRYRIRPSCAPDPTRLPPGAAAAPPGFLAHASLASLSHSPAAPGESRSWIHPGSNAVLSWLRAWSRALRRDDDGTCRRLTRPHPCPAPPRGGAGWRRGIPGRAALHAPGVRPTGTG